MVVRNKFGNGARQVLHKYFDQFGAPSKYDRDDLVPEDHLLVFLYAEGFMVSPIGDGTK